MLVRIKCKGIKNKEIIIPNIPEHRYNWRINKYDKKKGVFEIIEDIPEEEYEKIKDVAEIIRLEDRVAYLEKLVRKILAKMHV